MLPSDTIDENPNEDTQRVSSMIKEEEDNEDLEDINES